MKREVAPQETTRAEAFSLWMTSPMPMVTLTKTFNVTNVLRASKRRGVKFNALLCWCIGKAASHIEEFYILPEKDKLFQYDSLAINVIVNNCKGGINSCDIAYTDDIGQ
jgi:chloramphenicol O-acetyltransferase type A